MFNIVSITEHFKTTVYLSVRQGDFLARVFLHVHTTTNIIQPSHYTYDPSTNHRLFTCMCVCAATQPGQGSDVVSFYLVGQCTDKADDWWQKTKMFDQKPDCITAAMITLWASSLLLYFLLCFPSFCFLSVSHLSV